MRFYFVIILVYILLTVSLYSQESNEKKFENFPSVFIGYSLKSEIANNNVNMFNCGFGNYNSINNYLFGFSNINIKIDFEKPKENYLISFIYGFRYGKPVQKDFYLLYEIGSGLGAGVLNKTNDTYGISSMARIGLGYSQFSLFYGINYFISKENDLISHDFGIMYSF